MRPAWALTLLLFLQLLLGVMVVLLQKPADITSSHVAIGALILLTTFIIAIRARRLGHATTVAAAPKPQQQFPSPSTSNPLTA
jgi:heme A synthase